jgi:hypothetical protein
MIKIQTITAAAIENPIGSASEPIYWAGKPATSCRLRSRLLFGLATVSVIYVLDFKFVSTLRCPP